VTFVEGTRGERGQDRTAAARFQVSVQGFIPSFRVNHVVLRKSGWSGLYQARVALLGITKSVFFCLFFRPICIHQPHALTSDETKKPHFTATDRRAFSEKARTKSTKSTKSTSSPATTCFPSMKGLEATNHGFCIIANKPNSTCLLWLSVAEHDESVAPFFTFYRDSDAII